MAPTKVASSQEVIDQFWKSSLTPVKPPDKVSAILPRNVYAQMVEQQAPKGITATASITASYEESKKMCEAKVAQIVKECRQINEKYSDPYFDLDYRYHCLDPLSVIKEEVADPKDPPPPSPPPSSNPVLSPPSVKRVGDIFDNPQFFVEGVSAKDIRQGSDGDCWFLSALATLCGMEPGQDLVERVCVARDEEVGVYGFVLYRDGEWISVIVDDKLYLRKADYEDSDANVRAIWEDNRIRINSAAEYQKEFQSNSRALYYAQSTHPDETWVPLLEKAFAKAHGDYSAIESGSVGEGVEDLTGGISTTISATNILSKDKFWTEGLRKVNTEYLFGCGTQDWDDPNSQGRDGIHGGHAYSILRAENYNGERLLLVKNPWGEGEWNGPWSDGSSQWTAESIKALGHTFGDDGVFWIRFEDLLRKFNVLWRTRLFNADWQVTQQWMRLAVPWAGEYQDAKYKVVIAKKSPTVIVLSQLNDRYFRGLQGQYVFQLSFRLHKSGQEDYIMRTNKAYYGQRSVSVELDLDAGAYEVRLKISASRDDDADKVEDIVRTNWLVRREKLLQIGLSYDLAHAKGQVEETEEEKKKAKAATETKPKTTEAKPAGRKLDATPNGASASTPDKVSPEVGASKPELQNQQVDSRIDENGQPSNVDGEPQKPEDEPKEVEAEPEKFQAEPKENDDRPADDPWGAVCVVGLRVYCKGSDATVQIVGSKEDVTEKPELDIDDPARDATKKAEVVNGSLEKEKEDGTNGKGGGLKKVEAK